MRASLRPLPRGAWTRSDLEFGRVVTFTDAVFAIALTLLIVSVGLPAVAAPTNAIGSMFEALQKQVPEFVSFFVAFVIIGRYWMAHHRFTSLLRAIDSSFISITLIYLAFVAFLPYPTSLVGNYEENPLSVLLFAACLSIVSSLEVVLFRYAYRHDLLRIDLSPESYRWVQLTSLVPVAVFVVTAPLALVSTTLVLLSWLVNIPLQIVIQRHAPESADELLLAGASDAGADRPEG